VGFASGFWEQLVTHVAEPSAPRRLVDPDGADRPVSTSLERAIAAVERHWRWALLVLVLADAALLLYMGRSLSFFYDDWNYVTEDYGGGLHSLLRAHNGHMSIFPVAIYKVLFHLVGLDHYAVFRLVLILVHLTCAALIFVLASRRVARVPALLVTALILFLGVAWEDLLWAFQISFMLSVAGGLAAWVLLERRDRLGDIGAMLGVALALGSSGLGIPVAIGVAVELGWQREWRRGFIVVAPVLLYLLWYLHYGEDELTKNGLINAPGFAEDIAAAAFGGLLGRSLDWGRPIALLCSVALLRQLAYARHISARLVGLLLTGVSLWVLTAAARSTISAPETSRYVYLGAVIVVLIGVELLQGVLVRPRVVVLATLVVALGAITGLTALNSGALGLRSNSATVTADLGALELAANHASPGFQPAPQLAPQILAGPYLHTVHAIGSSPADTPAEIAAADPVSRAAADAILIALDTPTLTPLRTAPSPPAAVPAVTSVTSGNQLQHGGCVDLTPLPGTTMTATLTLPRGGVAIHDLGAGLASAALRRFGETFVPLSTSVSPHGAVALSLPPDAAHLPWRLELASSSTLATCGLST
jgi:hypothetical protein